MKYLSAISYCQTIISSMTKISLIRASLILSFKVQNGIKLITKIRKFSRQTNFSLRTTVDEEKTSIL